MCSFDGNIVEVKSNKEIPTHSRASHKLKSRGIEQTTNTIHFSRHFATTRIKRRKEGAYGALENFVCCMRTYTHTFGTDFDRLRYCVPWRSDAFCVYVYVFFVVRKRKQNDLAISRLWRDERNHRSRCYVRHLKKMCIGWL